MVLYMLLRMFEKGLNTALRPTLPILGIVVGPLV